MKTIPIRSWTIGDVVCWLGLSLRRQAALQAQVQPALRSLIVAVVFASYSVYIKPQLPRVKAMFPGVLCLDHLFDGQAWRR